MTSGPRAGGTRVVAIDGPSGSGKTVLADRLAEVVARRPDADGRPQVVHMDDLYAGWDGLEAAVPLLVADVLAPLAAGAPAAYPRYDWAEGRYAQRVPVPPGPWLVIEGVSSGARACAPYLSALAWLDAPEEERLRRGIARDGEAYRPHWERWARQERAHFAREGTALRADVRREWSFPRTMGP